MNEYKESRRQSICEQAFPEKFSAKAENFLGT